MKAKFTEGKLLLVPEEPRELLDIIAHMASTEVIDVDHDACKALLMKGSVVKAKGVDETKKEEVVAAVNTEDATSDAATNKPPNEMSRDEIKEALNARGIDFNPKSRTNKLMELLQKAKEGKLEESEPKAAVEPEAEAADATVGEAPSRDDVFQVMRQIIIEQGKEKGKPKVKALLAEFGAPNISGVKEEDYVALMTKARAVLKGE